MTKDETDPPPRSSQLKKDYYTRGTGHWSKRIYRLSLGTWEETGNIVALLVREVPAI